MPPARNLAVDLQEAAAENLQPKTSYDPTLLHLKNVSARNFELYFFPMCNLGYELIIFLELHYCSYDLQSLQLIDLNASTIHASSMPNFSNDMYGQSSAMMIPSIQEGYANATMPYFNMHMSSSAMDARVIHGGYTGLLLRVDRDATAAARKLRFDGVPNDENI
ncbi:hypothetical protein EJB05_10237, partial [Eragrostis curvula]